VKSDSFANKSAAPSVVLCSHLYALECFLKLWL